MIKKVETIHQLGTHLIKYVAAYRKSYKICRSAHLSRQILAGLLGWGAVLVLVPAVPIFKAIAGALPAGISKAQFKEKENLYKGCHCTFKQLLREVQMNQMRPGVDVIEIIRETFSNILDLEKGANYGVPFERYIWKSISLMDIIARNKIPITFLRWDSIRYLKK